MGNTDTDGPTPTDQQSQRVSSTFAYVKGVKKSGGCLIHTCGKAPGLHRDTPEPWYNCSACREESNYSWHMGRK